MRLRAHRPDGPLPTVTQYPTDTAEAAAVARRVRDSHQPGGRWSRQAVLVRTNGQTVLLEQALRAAGVPCRIRGGSGLLTQPEVKAALRDLRRSHGPFATAIADLGAMAAQIRAAEGTPDDTTGAEGNSDGPAEGADDRAANLETLQRLARDYATLVPNPMVSGFVAWLSTSTGGDEGGTSDAVEISTFHAAKGLEWSVVHLAGLEDGLVPIGHARGSADKDEERRLFYVAVTRAEQHLHCTWAAERTFGERTASRRRSPYLDEAIAAGAFGQSEPLDHATTGRRSRGSGQQRPSARRGTRDGRTRTTLTGEAADIHERLRAWRSNRAKAARVPAYTVFNDETLDDLVRLRPQSEDELLEVRGIGPIKVSRFGDELISLIAGPAQTHADSP